MTDLDDAVSALVDPVIYHHTIGERTFIVELECRLDQLQGAITNTLRSAVSSNAAKNERSVLNSEALETFTRIASHIGSWCIKAGLPTTRDVAHNLKQWAATVTDPPIYRIEKMLEWATTIDAQFKPTRRAVINNPCPVCKATVWVDDQGEKHLHPLERSHIEGELLTSVQASCRACSASWEGAEAVAELGDELKE